MILPLLNPSITSIYGASRGDNKIHTGLDMISTSGDRNVKAIVRGTVRVVAYDPTGYGNYVSVQQEDGVRALYCHLESASVVSGEFVEEGQLIGIEGTTGNSTGIHLHLELRIAPYNAISYIDPASYLGIENKLGIVEEVPEVPIFTEGRQAFDYLVERGKITSVEYWSAALEIVNDLEWIMIKWANDVANMGNQNINLEERDIEEYKDHEVET